MGYIYKIVNKITEETYVGATTRIMRLRIKDHRKDVKNNSKMRIHIAIREFGWENFRIEIIEETDDLENRERFWIKELNTLYPNGYNDTKGGKHLRGEECHFYGDTTPYAKGSIRSDKTKNILQEQHRGRKPNIKTTSKYVGVYRRPGKDFFEAYIWYDKRTHYLGRHDTEEDAARAYNNAALKYFGEDAKLNIFDK